MAPRPAALDTHQPLTGFSDILRSELCKLRSVRSTYWTLVAAVVFSVGFAALEATFLPGRLSDHDKATLDAVRVSLGGSHLSQIAIGVLGVLVITSEYTTGMIRATVGAVPRRSLVLAAKAIVFAATGLVVGVAASFAAYFVFEGLLSGDDLRSSIGDPGVVRALIGGGLYLAVIGLLGLGLGAIIRASSGRSRAVRAAVRSPGPRRAAPADVEDHCRSVCPHGSGQPDLFSTSRSRWPRTVGGLRCLLPLCRHRSDRWIRPHQPSRRLTTAEDSANKLDQPEEKA
jgi:hypothetical protein